jgi:hypothetical protein
MEERDQKMVSHNLNKSTVSDLNALHINVYIPGTSAKLILGNNQIWNLSFEVPVSCKPPDFQLE